MTNQSNRSLYKGTQMVWYILFIIEGLLVIRFALKLFQANPEALFTNFIYAVSDVLVLPFLAVFENVSVSTSVFEWTTLLAMLVYWLLALVIIKLFIVSKPVSAVEADQKLTEQDY